jgi:hypothetical protein
MGCKGGKPCANCKSRNLICEYPPAQRTRGLGKAPKGSRSKKQRTKVDSSRQEAAASEGPSGAAPALDPVIFPLYNVVEHWETPSGVEEEIDPVVVEATSTSIPVRSRSSSSADAPEVGYPRISPSPHSIASPPPPLLTMGGGSHSRSDHALLIEGNVVPSLPEGAREDQRCRCPSVSYRHIRSLILTSKAVPPRSFPNAVPCIPRGPPWPTPLPARRDARRWRRFSARSPLRFNARRRRRLR